MSEFVCKRLFSSLWCILQAGMKAFREKILADTLEGKVKCFFIAF